LDEPFLVDVIGVAAIKLNRPEQPTKEVYEKVMKEKMQLIIDIAVENKIDALVLGALGKPRNKNLRSPLLFLNILLFLGCGAFNNDPLRVSNLFCEIIAENAGKVWMITFAITDNKRDSDPLLNLKSFEKVFGNMNDPIIFNPGALPPIPVQKLLSLVKKIYFKS
jgi:hypothetical protein